MADSDVAAPIELPVIDISDPHDPAVGKAMLDAAAKYGFLYVNSKGSDFTPKDVDHAFGLVRMNHPLYDLYMLDADLYLVKEVLCIPRRGEGDMPHHAQCKY
jgi:hypothetical protein